MRGQLQYGYKEGSLYFRPSTRQTKELTPEYFLKDAIVGIIYENNNISGVDNLHY